MTETATTMDVRRVRAASVIDIKGDITAGSEDVLMDAYRSAADGVRVVILSFADLEYMNSGGIGPCSCARSATATGCSPSGSPSTTARSSS